VTLRSEPELGPFPVCMRIDVAGAEPLKPIDV
jgi:hypothetical protein